MKLDKAIEECERWFEYLENQRKRTLELQKLATLRRNQRIDEIETKERLRRIHHDAVVYDGAELEKAVKVLLKHIHK